MKQPAILQRKSHSYKNDFGHVLVVGGSPTMLGAVCLTALASMRSGSGLTTVAIPNGLNLALQEKISPVVMTLPVAQTRAMTFALPAYQQLEQVQHRFQSVALGPGIGLQPITRKFVLKMIAHYPLPMVIDADALNALSEQPDILLKSPAPRILTPHPGEMARLAGFSNDTVQSDRKNVALRFAAEYHCVLVLKGHHTIIAGADGKFRVNKTGNPGMATAGSGDVLTGMIAAFLGQGLVSYDAAVFGVYAHGQAGDTAAGKRSVRTMIASDIIDNIR